MCCSSLLAASTISITGKVTDGSKGISGAAVSLVKVPAVKTTTDTGGNFTLTGSTQAIAPLGVSIIAAPQFGVQIDVYFSQFEGRLLSELLKLLLSFVTEMASGAGIEHHLG